MHVFVTAYRGGTIYKLYYCFDSHIAFAEKPSAPGKPQISNITGTSMHVDWSPPESDGGCPLSGYVLEYQLDGGMSLQQGLTWLNVVVFILIR